MGVPRGVYTNYGRRSTRTVSTNNNSYAADQDTAEDFGTDATEYEEFSVLTSSVFGDKFGLVFSGVNAYMQEHMQSRTGVLFGARAPYVFQNSRTLVVCWRPTFNHFGLLSAGEKAKCEAYMEAYNAQLRRILGFERGFPYDGYGRTYRYVHLERVVREVRRSDIDDESERDLRAYDRYS